MTRPLKIHVDYSNFKDFPQETLDFIQKNLFPMTVEFLSSRLKVLTKGAPYRMPESKCDEAVIPEEHQTVGVDADLVIYVTGKDEPQGEFLAWAGSCFLDSVTKRPFAGIVNFNTAFIKTTHSDFEPQVDIVIHEIMHILAFCPNLFENFKKGFHSSEFYAKSDVIENVVVGGRNKSIIKTPNVIRVAQDYFKCSNIRGVETEDQGGDGSAGAHWERAILHNEIMTASEVKDASFSDFTIALLQDSGWYQVDYSKSEPMYFGKGAGCSFMELKCKAPNLANRNEWCSGDASVCSFDYKSKTHCTIEAFSDDCRYASPNKEGDCENSNNQLQYDNGETYEEGSRCVMSNIISKEFELDSVRPSCFPKECIGNNEISIKLADGHEIICSKKGEVVNAPEESYFQGHIICPDPQDFCKDRYPACLNNCSYQGYCLKGNCECSPNYTGEDCSIENTE